MAGPYARSGHRPVATPLNLHLALRVQGVRNSPHASSTDVHVGCACPLCLCVIVIYGSGERDPGPDAVRIDRKIGSPQPT